MGSSWRTAEPGHVPCHLCHRYLDPEKLEDGRCINRVGCNLVASRFFNRARMPSKKQRREWGMR